MINLAVPNLTGNEKKYLDECIDTTFVSSVGRFVTKLEELCCEKTGAKYSVATSCGTTGLQLALLAVGVKKDELVLIPSLTFIATANAVKHCGADPWCIDINKESWTISPRALNEELKTKTKIIDGKVIHIESGKRVAAIMPVYTLGTPADMDEINNIADKYNLPVIADAAAAIGAKYKKRDIGDIATLTVFSFNGNKTITCGGGGMVVGNNKELIEKIRHLSTTARVSKQYDHDMVGFNYRMTNVQAAIGCAQIERLDDFIMKKHEIRNFYNNHFKDIEDIKLFPYPEYADSACWFSGVVLENANSKIINEICDELLEEGIEARSFWKPIHLQKPYLEVKKSCMINTEYIWDKIITLPCSTNITDKELEEVYNKFMLLYKKKLKK